MESFTPSDMPRDAAALLETYRQFIEIYLPVGERERAWALAGCYADVRSAPDLSEPEREARLDEILIHLTQCLQRRNPFTRSDPSPSA